MRTSLAIAAALILPSLPLVAGEETFYMFGALKGVPDRTILKGQLNTETGKLGPVTAAVEGIKPGFFTLSDDGKFLYTGNFGGKITALSIGSDGNLTAVNEQAGAGSGVCHVVLGGGHLFTANYMSSDMAIFPVKSDGALGEKVAVIPFTGTGPNTRRQEKPHPHSTWVSSDQKFVYLCDLGSDNVWSFKLDPATGQVTPTEPPSGRTPDGAGPRHLAWGDDEKIAYVCNEMGHSVTVFARNPDTGILTPLQTISTLPEGTPIPEKSTVAEILVHPSRKFVYVSTRGPDTITVFAKGDDGKLTFVENVSAGVKTPRSFAIDPTGKWLIAAGQQDNRIAVLKIDPATGKLTPTDQQAELDGVECVKFAVKK